MISLSPNSRIIFCTSHIDFRNGIDGLVALCKNHLKLDPFAGALVLFRNRQRTAIKAIIYDGQGFWLFQKRLSEGKFKWWPTTIEQVSNLSIHELHVFLANGNPEKALLGKNFK